MSLASAAPAFADSCAGGDYQLSWHRDEWVHEQGALEGVAHARPASAVPGQVSESDLLPIRITSSFGGRARATTFVTGSRTARNMEVTPAAVGGLSGAYGLALVQNFGSNTSLGADSAARRQHFQQVTFSFGERTVQDLRFTITDIDRSAEDRRQFWDQIELAPLPTTLTPAGGVVGTGASSDPLRNQTAADHDFYASPDGNVTVDYGATPISSLVVTYWNDMAGVLVESGRQLITISDLSFTLVSEGC